MKSPRPLMPIRPPGAVKTCRCGKAIQYRSDRTSGLYYHLDTGEPLCADGGPGGPVR